MADCRRDSGIIQSREISRAKISERLEVPGPSLPSGAVRAVGPRQLRLKRCENGYGFTLRHFIVYPPDSLADGLAPPGLALTEPMDTIFVKSVRPNSPADQAGLATGDRIIAVNGQTITRHTYAQVVQLIQQSGPTLALLVVSKEEDLLQRYFGETAHNPETNNRPSPRRLRSPEKNSHFSSSPRRDSRFSDASSCCFITEPTKPNEVDPRWTGHFSTKDTLFGCSEGSTPPPSLSSSSSSTMTMTTPSMMENNASSKDSLTSSYDSASTLTSALAGESEDLVLSRLRKSFEQKEEFLRSGWQQQQQQINRGGFYSRPQRFQKPLWPPPNEPPSNTTSTTPPINNVSSNSTGSTSASPKRFATSLHRIHENQTVENNENQDSSIGSNDSSTPSTSRHSAFYTSPTSLQLVSRRAKQFEAAASAAATDDPNEDPRTNFYRSELSRLSTSKRAVAASVAVRRKEFESRSHSAEHPSRHRLTTGTHRESRSLEANAAASVSPPSSSTAERSDGGRRSSISTLRLSGNRTTPIGSRYLHCPPPSDVDDYFASIEASLGRQSSHSASEPPESTRGTNNDIPTRRPRSNSVESSWPSSHERRSRPTTHHGAIIARPILRRTHEVDIEENKRSPSPPSTTTMTSTSTTTTTTTSINSYQSTKPQRPTRLELPVVTCTGLKELNENITNFLTTLANG